MPNRLITCTTAAALLGATLLIGGGASAHGRDPVDDAVNLPPHGRVDFILGQDGGTLATFHDEVLAVDRRHPRPSGVSLFTSLNGLTPLNGLWSAVDYNVGRTQYEEVLSQYSGALTIGVELIDYSQDLGTEGRNLASAAIAGDPSVDQATIDRYRGWVDELILYSKATRRDVFLKIGYEFDGHWNNYEPETYKGAFRYIARRIDELGARNVATVWQSATWAAAIPDKPVVGAAAYEAAEAVLADSNDHWDLWYPGDDAVDWMGISQFATQSFERPGGPWACDRGAPGEPDTTVVAPRALQDHLLDYARSHRKPVMIAEAAPQGYDLGELTVACIFSGGAPWDNRTAVTVDDVWNEWFQPTFDYVEANRDVIRSVTYINTDWDSQGNWSCVGPDACGSGYWGDSRLEANDEILSRVKEELSDRRVWTRGRRWVRPFRAPDFSEGRGVYEAEYAQADTWLDCCGLGGLPQVNLEASNGREVMIMNFGDGGAGSYGIDFERVRRGSGITVSLSSLGQSCCTPEGSGATYRVLVNGVDVTGDVPVPDNTYPAPQDFEFDARVPWRATVRVEINPNAGGNLIWLDKIEVTR